MKNNFANNLKYYRKKNQLSQYELAKILNINRSTIASYETGKRECCFDVLIDISELFNISIDELLK